MKLTEKTRRELLEVEGVGLTSDDLDVLEDYLNGVVSEQQSIECGIAVSDASRLSKIVKLLQEMPKRDIEIIEHRLCADICRHWSKRDNDYDFHSEPESPQNYLIQNLSALTNRKSKNGRGNRNQRSTLIRRHLFLEVCAFFIVEKKKELDDINTSNWFFKFMDKLTNDKNVKNELCQYISKTGEYIDWAKTFYPLREQAYRKD